MGNYPPKKDNVLISKDVSCETDELSHLYTLIIRPNNTFEVKVDNKTVREGKIEDEFDMLPPKEIKDPKESKPEDWDDEDDGEWEAPYIDNPEYKGPWEPKMIPNPEYKGPWIHPMIPNPDYKHDDSLWALCN